jgi:ribosome-associated translation inhibitor RaiA
MARQVLGRATGDIVLDVVAKGIPLDEATLAYARRKILAAARASQVPVRFGRVKFTYEPNPSIARPAIVTATLDVDGHPVRAQSAGRTTREAVDILEERLRRQLVDSRHRLAFLRRRRRAATTTGEWRHGGIPADRPEHFPRAPEERQVVRRKTFSLGRRSPEDAVVEMELLDHDFHLFVESGTGRDALVRRIRDGTYELSRASGDHEDPAEAGGVGVGVGPPPQVMMLEEAVDRLNVTNEPFLFFIDVETLRGAVLYRRHDGHYGVVTPGSEPAVEKEEPR